MLNNSIIIGSDVIPYRFELYIFIFIFSTIATSLLILIALLKTPNSMKGYRIHIIDSLVACWLFSFTMDLLYVPYFLKSNSIDETFFFSVSFISYCLLDFATIFQILALALSVVNVFRANLQCFKYRFEFVVVGKLKIAHDRVKDLLYWGILISILIIVVLLIEFCFEETGQRLQFGRISFILPPNLSVNPNRVIILWPVIGPFSFIGIVYVSYFAFLITGTYWVLWKSKQLVMKNSKKTIMAQRTAFLMLLIQGTFTLGLGLLVVFFATLTVFTSISIFSTLTNISLLLCGVPYGCIYPFVVLITTRPYLDYMKRLFFQSVFHRITQVATIPTSTVQ